MTSVKKTDLMKDCKMIIQTFSWVISNSKSVSVYEPMTRRFRTNEYQSQTFVVQNIDKQRLLTCKLTMFVKNGSTRNNEVLFNLVAIVNDVNVSKFEMKVSKNDLGYPEVLWKCKSVGDTIDYKPDHQDSIVLSGNDNTTLSVEIEVSLNTKDPNLTKLMRDYETLLTDQKHTDVSFLVDGKEIKVLKCLIIARSPVFAKMFEQKMQESENNVVHIKDFSFEVVKAMLGFIYSANTALLNENTLQLLGIADKYELDDMKQVCEEKLLNQLTIENVAMTILKSEPYNTKMLFGGCIEFFQMNCKAVTSTKTWDSDFGQMSASLANQLLKAIISSEK